MDLLEKLKQQGWFLTEDGLKKLTTATNLQVQDVNKIISIAINWDFKDIASGALPIKPESNGTIPGRIVLQIQKMRNISAPKANEESTAAPRFLQLELSDGTCSIPALEIERISSLNLNLPPGTKLFLRSDKLQLLHGFLVLKSSDVEVLGGKVGHLVEKWEVARQMLKYARSNRRMSGSGGPPPWIAFGKRLDTHKDALSADKNFKSLKAATESDKRSKENEDFNASRSQAIAEAAKAGQKKVFGGGQQNILDHNVKKILEKGYTEEVAKQELKTTNNNLERALYNLKRRNNRGPPIENKAKSTVSSNGARGVAATKEVTSAIKPQTNVSLFDFLTDKLPGNVSNSIAVSQSNTNTERNSKDHSKALNNNSKTTGNAANKFENNMSSSFQANRAVAAPTQNAKQSLTTKVKNGKSMERNNSNKTQTQIKHTDKASSQPPSTSNENTQLVVNNNNNKRNDQPVRKESEKNLKQSSSGYQGSKRTGEYKTTDNKPYHSRDNRNISNGYQSQQKQKYKRNNYEKEIDTLVEGTAKMKIESKKDYLHNTSQSKNNQQHPKNGNQQQLPSTKRDLSQQNVSYNYDNNKQYVDSQTVPPKSSSHNQKSVTYIDQAGSGFIYDHSKIVGFQSKEANEYAMNLLKSQGLPMQQIHQQQTAKSQAQEVALLPPPPPPQQLQQHPSGQTLNPQATPTIAYVTQSSNMFIAPCQQAPSQFNTMSGGNWIWKIGDLCLAKYWDDGNYYEAKITAVSEKTCVVLFLGYGNHEEVLKSDCLPLTDGQHIPINPFQANIAASPLQQPPPSFQQRSGMQSGGTGTSGLSNQRYRGERQMYIPPPKRGNN